MRKIQVKVSSLIYGLMLNIQHLDGILSETGIQVYKKLVDVYA